MKKTTSQSTSTPEPGPQKPKRAEDCPVDEKPDTQPEGEVGGPKGPEPTRYGDWENAGRCTDF